MVFLYDLNSNQLNKACLTLNSSNLYLNYIIYGLEQLKLKTDDSLFHLIANHWIEKRGKSFNVYKKEK